MNCRTPKDEARGERRGGAGLRRTPRSGGSILRVASRRALILPVVLVLIGLLAMTIGGFIFFIRAETAGSIAHSTQQQAWLATKSALEDAVATLRLNRHNPAAWFDVPGRWRHALVYSPAYDREGDPVRQQGTRKELFERGARPAEAWRYSLVGQAVNGVEDAMRFGVTPEAGKLNINAASEEQITRLLMPILTDLAIENPQEVVAAVLDWIDADSDAREGGAEDAYYNTLKPPYRAKNGPLDTIEELLLVKDFNAILLYGEDTNRNGIMDTNENDGDASPPLFDNRDGNIDRGLAPFITTWSREPDTALDNKPRINLNLDASVVQAQIAEQIPDGVLSDATIQFITGLKQQGIEVARLGSPAMLYPLPEGEEYELPQAPGASGAPDAPRQGEQDDGKSGEAPAGGEDDGQEGSGDQGGGKVEARSQSRSDRPSKGDDPKGADPQEADPDGGDKPAKEDGTGSDETGAKGTGGAQPPLGGRRSGGRGSQAPGGAPTMPRLGADGSPTAGSPGAPGGGAPNLEVLRSSPVTLKEMPTIMDRFTVRTDAGAEGIRGLININTADARVLALIPGITPEAVGAIVQMRGTLPPVSLQTTAWPLVSQAVDAKTFHQIAPYITTKAYQFHVEALGYADHVKIAKRCEWIIEMIGPVPQVRYYRDLTSLGVAWPLDREQVTVTTQ